VCALALAACTSDPVDPFDPFDGGALRADAGTVIEPDTGIAETDAGTMMEPGPCPRVRITTVGISLNVRSEPSTDGTIVGTVDEGAIVAVVSTITGDVVEGIDVWYEIAEPAAGFISGRWAECTTDEPPMPRDGFYLPLECGMSARVSQGNNTTFSHNGNSRYAFDFSLGRGTPLHAMADGVVNYLRNDTRPGDPCYDGGGRECIAEANVVWLRHADGTRTVYAHLNEALVRLDQRVTRGTPVGLSGSSGWSTGPHAHVARIRGCTDGVCPTIPLSFEDVPGDGVPETGDTVTSDNCP
jgi:hypothetical protein